MSIKQDRTGTRTAEDLRRRLNVTGITETKEKVDASVETVNKLNNQVINLGNQLTGLNNTVTNTRENYVSTNAQDFTKEQKTRARENIGAGTSSFSGSYEDLTDTPTIPTKLSELENDSGFINDSGSITPINVLNTKSESTTDTYSCDYINGIIESGSNDNGSWTKWADGTMIVNKTIYGTTDITTAWGSLYASSVVNLGAFPVSFIDRPTIIVSPQTQTGTQYMLTGSSGGDGYGTKDSAGYVCLIRPNSRTDVAYVLDVMAKGKWK